MSSLVTWAYWLLGPYVPDEPLVTPTERCTECGSLELTKYIHMDADLADPGWHCHECCWLPITDDTSLDKKSL